jgi:nucleotide-binding universal stress UspA family protein
MSYATALVGIDGSESSLLAVDRAAEVAAAMDAVVIVVCAYHPMTAREQALITAALGDTKYRVTGTAAAQEALDTAVSRAREAGATRVEGRLVVGDAVEALLSVARERSADLIVVGNRGINTFSGRLLGSVPADMCHRAHCDVLIVHTVSGGGR